MVYVKPGEYQKGRINLDTGNKEGIVLEENGRTVYFDHHGKTSKKGSSTTEMVYKSLVGLGLLKKTKYLDALVKFTTQVDNRSFPQEPKYYKDSGYNLLGLERHMNFDQMLKYFKSGLSPVKRLTSAEIKRFGLAKASREQGRNVEISLSRLKEMSRNGLVIDTPKYGKIAIDINKKVPDGFPAARAMGLNGYVIWNPGSKSFFISTTKPFKGSFAQGQGVRETMWIKRDTKKLTVKLSDVVSELAGKGFKSTGELKAYLESVK